MRLLGCGIIGIIAKKPVAAELVGGLKRLEYRGYDSAGIATLINGRIERRRAEGKLSNLVARLEKEPVQGTIGIGHTRWATHGQPSEKNAHPIATNKVAVVHNGIIENFQALKRSWSGSAMRSRPTHAVVTGDDLLCEPRPPSVLRNICRNAPQQRVDKAYAFRPAAGDRFRLSHSFNRIVESGMLFARLAKRALPPSNRVPTIMTRTFLKSTGLVGVLVCGLLMLSSHAIAGPITYGCTAGSDCDGNAYALSVISHVGNTYQIEYDIKVLSTYTGNKWTDVVETVATKDFVASFSNFSLVSAPGGVSNWVLVQNELNANGCSGGSPSTEICMQAAGSYPDANDPQPGGYLGAPVLAPPVAPATEILSWVFQFDSTGPINSLGHIKYEYETPSGTDAGACKDAAAIPCDGEKVGSLGSWDIAIQNSGGGGGQTEVPEPASLLLLGSALAGLGLMGRRRRKV